MNKQAEAVVPKSDYKDICTLCWGKGYSSHFYGISGSEDLDVKGFEEPKKVHIEYCRCMRGKQLHAVVEKKQAEAQMLITKRIYDRTKNITTSGFIKTEALKKLLQGYYNALQKDRPILKT